MKLIKIIIFLLISLIHHLKLIQIMIYKYIKEGGKLIFIRHAYAPGGGDPDNFEYQIVHHNEI